MSKCLVTKLQEVVSNPNLPTLGVLELQARKLNTVTDVREISCAFATKAETVISVTGNGYFSRTVDGEGNLLEHLTSLTISQADGRTRLYFANDNYTIRLSDKYNLTQIFNDYTGSIADRHLIGFDLFDIKYCIGLSHLHCYKFNITGDVENLTNCTDLTTIVLNGTNTYGDVSFCRNMEYLSYIHLVNAYGNISVFTGKAVNMMRFNASSNLTGDISALANCFVASTNVLDVSATNVYGDVSVFAGKSIASLNIYNCPSVTGNISYLVSMPLSRLALQGTDVYGDISVIGSSSTISSFNMDNTRVSGTFDTLGNNKLLTEMGFSNVANISGTIEGFVANNITAGRSSASLSTKVSSWGILDKVTFGGSLFANMRRAIITWESNSKIIVYCGGNVYDDWTTVLAKGATAEEIATWKAASKSVFAYENGEWVEK